MSGDGKVAQIELQPQGVATSSTGQDNPSYLNNDSFGGNSYHPDALGGRSGNKMQISVDERAAGPIARAQDKIYQNLRQAWPSIKIGLLVVLACLFVAYFIVAMITEQLENEGSIRLLVMTIVVILVVVLLYLYRFLVDNNSLDSGKEFMQSHSSRISWTVVALLAIIILAIVIYDVAAVSGNPYNLVSLAGLLVYVFLMFLFSYSPAQVNWRAVCWGIALQFVFALIILRWSAGFRAFEWLGNRVSEFLAHTDAGSEFIFGKDTYMNHFFAFKVLPIVIFFSAITSVLYYLQVIQPVIMGIAKVMQVTMGTSPPESVNAAANIFIGQSEAPLLIRPMLPQMTCSEIHAIMTGGFATIAGTVMGAFINFGVPPNHLLSASVMSAPAALAISKLFYPETKKSRTSSEEVREVLYAKSEMRNVFEAISNGASVSISLIANIAVNLIAFIAVLQFLNATLCWFTERVNLQDRLDLCECVEIQTLLGYVMWPFALLMGVEAKDCLQVGRLIAIKTTVNEFVAYDGLGKLIRNRKDYEKHVSSLEKGLINGSVIRERCSIILQNTTWVKLADLQSKGPDPAATEPEVNYLQNKTIGNETWVESYTNKSVPLTMLSVRSETISTYALCGFANFGSMGIMIGALSAMAPDRKSDIAATVFRALIAGTVACFMTACIAGIFYNPLYA